MKLLLPKIAIFPSDMRMLIFHTKVLLLLVNKVLEFGINSITFGIKLLIFGIRVYFNDP